MLLSEFIQENRNEIVKEWIAFARTLAPWSNGLTTQELRDHADELLRAVTADMGKSQSKLQQSEKSKGHDDADGELGQVGQSHAIERLASGLTLDQLVSEYRALRASVLRLWEEAQLGDKTQEVTRFNEAIDEALAQSAASFSLKMMTTRDQFLAILGHDLRNPLASVIMGASALTRSDTLDVKQLGIATRIANSGARMDRMVSDLLDLTRTRLGAGIPVVLRPVDLAPVCQQVVAELEAVHPDRVLKVELHGDLKGTWDSDRLSQVISNLVANALQHSDDERPILLAARGASDHVLLSVHNAGEPIGARALKSIFDPMVRHPGEVDTHVTGLGLGLYIAREIAKAHGGNISVTSTNEEGTTFTVELPRRLPKALAPREAAPPATARRKRAKARAKPQTKAKLQTKAKRAKRR